MTPVRILKKLYMHLPKRIHRLFRFFYVKKLRRSFTNRDLSVFSQNCVGGCMLHDLNVRFNSPFVNLYMNAADYLKFLQDPKKYCSLEFCEIKSDADYPVATLGDLTIHFVHYKSFEEAIASFKKRVERINYDNLFVIFLERDGCTYADLLTFDRLPYEHKIVFTHLPYEDIQSSFYIEGFETEDGVGNLIHWDKKFGRKIYDRFAFSEWLNG